MDRIKWLGDSRVPYYGDSGCLAKQQYEGDSFILIK